jgi:hypothetical protein
LDPNGKSRTQLQKLLKADGGLSCTLSLETIHATGNTSRAFSAKADAGSRDANHARSVKSESPRQN